MAYEQNANHVYAEITVGDDGGSTTVRLEVDSFYGSDRKQTELILAQRAMNGFVAANGLEGVE